ncbi:MAG: aldo/keto reductase [Syntrophales bacterium]|nr:aldo/keto reductase [Syntrophales bacterium]MDD5641932.1 aldo/keto reductase [Syntrophales bacterium]
MDRREFIKDLTALGVSAGLATGSGLVAPARAASVERGMPYRVLGSTGEKVSLIGLGGFHLGHPEVRDSFRIIRTAIDHGVNFMDNSWDYNHGESEIRMGKALKDGYRQKVFLMTKVDGRTGAAATKQLEESLKRLQTETIDLLQFHELIRLSDPERIFAPKGAYEAMVKARKAGKIRYIGFTGHKSPAIHLKMLELCFAHNFTPAAVQMPLNVMDAHYDSFQKQVLPVLLQHGIGPLAMKPMGDHFILESKTVTPRECLHYDMNLPVAVVITGCDSLPILEQALTAARTYRPLSDREVAALLAKTTRAAVRGQYELYKTSDHFDSTVRNPQWLG